MPPDPTGLEASLYASAPARRALSVDRSRRWMRGLCVGVLALAGWMAVVAVGAWVRYIGSWSHPVILLAAITFSGLTALSLSWVAVHWPRRTWRGVAVFTRAGRWRALGLIGGPLVTLVSLTLFATLDLPWTVRRDSTIPPLVAGILVATIAFVGPLRMTANRRPFALVVHTGGPDDGSPPGPDPDAAGDAAEARPDADDLSPLAEPRLPLVWRLAHHATVAGMLAAQVTFPLWSGQVT